MLDRGVHRGRAGGPLRHGTFGGPLVRTPGGEEHADDRGDLLGRRGAEDPDRGQLLGRPSSLSPQSGMLPCFLGGSVSRLVRSARSAFVTFIRVFEGVMTVSMYPRSAAT